MHQPSPNSNVLAVRARDLDQNAIPIPLNDITIADGGSGCSEVQSVQSYTDCDCQDTVSSLLRKSSALTTILQSPGSSNINEGPEQHHSISSKDRHCHDTPRETLNVLKLWRWEIASLFVAIGLLGAMYGILRRYEDQRVPDWGPNISLNTLFATIATAIRICLIFVLAEIIGQAKWSYFISNARSTGDSPTRRLILADHFDQASRGFFGAVRLIPSIITDATTLSAILCVIFSSAIGTFVQQAIQTQICQFPLESASSSLPVLRNLKSGVMVDGKYSRRTPGYYSDLQAAMISALAPDNEEIGSPIAADCSTGNCTFSNSIDGIYSTVGICSYCTDTTSLISSTNSTTSGFNHDFGKSYTLLTTNYSLPNGVKITSKTLHFDDQENHGSELRAKSSYGFLDT
ncbi:hypothetical protein NUW58_g4454 [Xylaria curta]|uniref:Uncharacterized protein n=1 Tax=Xylaria curta TaxID=42375 RepID=A0ACC1P9A6_9PEZI|nr:hypothetical protein NUW58_g4454 [Xylaria curta]